LKEIRASRQFATDAVGAVIICVYGDREWNKLAPAATARKQNGHVLLGCAGLETLQATCLVTDHCRRPCDLNGSVC